MTAPITFNPSLSALQWPATLGPAPSATGPTAFQDLLARSLQDSRGANADAALAVQQSVTGDDLSMVETFTALREADLALRLTLQVRNKLVDAYNEIQQLRF